MISSIIESNLHEKIDQKLSEIVFHLKNQQESPLVYGLHSGLIGQLLFFMYLGKLKKDDHFFHLGGAIIEQLVNAIHLGQLDPSFSSGLAGFSWTIEHLVDQDLLELDTLEFLGESDEYLANKMIKKIDEGKFDFLNGAIGIGLCLLKRKNSQVDLKIYFEEFLEKIEALSIQENDGTLKWEGIFSVDGDRAINISISHGSASIALFIHKMYKAQVISSDRAIPLIERTIRYILKQELSPSETGCYFPNYHKTNPIKKSRLGWCYGDMGIGMCLWQLGKSLNRQDWVAKATEVLTLATKRVILKENQIVDAGLCHGTIGMAHMFHKLYIDTQGPAFKKAAVYWLEKTFEMAYHPNGIAGFMAYQHPNAGGWQSKTGMLTGVSGIGLAMVSLISGIGTDWDECLLLS